MADHLVVFLVIVIYSNDEEVLHAIKGFAWLSVLALQTEYPSRQYMVGESCIIYPSDISLYLFVRAADSVDWKVDRINRSQSAPEEYEHGHFLSLTVYINVKLSNPFFMSLF